MYSEASFLSYRGYLCLTEAFVSWTVFSGNWSVLVCFFFSLKGKTISRVRTSVSPIGTLEVVSRSTCVQYFYSSFLRRNTMSLSEGSSQVVVRLTAWLLCSLPDSAIGAVCRYSEECRSKTINSVCYNGRCLCSLGYHYSEEKDECSKGMLTSICFVPWNGSLLFPSILSPTLFERT
jgi:hypothetical protein